MMTRISCAIFRISFLATTLALGGCRNTGNQINISEPPGIMPVMQEMPKLTVPTDTSHTLFSGIRQKAGVSKYYQTYGSNPLWIKEGTYNGRADSMLSIVRRVEYYGLSASLYHLSELEVLMRSATSVNSVRGELLLTDAFLSLAGDLKYGVQNMTRKRSEDSLRIQLLNSMALNGNLKEHLESQEPFLEGYKNLKKGLHIMLDSVAQYKEDSISVSQNIHLISINIERWRRENIGLGSRYIFINIPSFMLEVVDHDTVVLSSRIIVGTSDRETPMMSSVVECFSIYPYWHVPRKISVEEYLPILKKDTTFLRRNNFDVLDRKGNVLHADSVQWNKFTERYFPVVLRQREGGENSLGIIKFIFDNPYAVFLHDTNTKSLFKRSSRAFSHGCIRMERAVDLAHYLVTGSVEAKSKTISKYLQEKKQRRIDLKNPIPIYTRYFTCDFKNGVINFYKDVYDKDRQLYDLLFKNTDQLQ